MGENIMFDCRAALSGCVEQSYRMSPYRQGVLRVKKARFSWQSWFSLSPIIGESAEFTARPFSLVLANLLVFDYRCNCAALVAALASRVFCPNALGALFLATRALARTRSSSSRAALAFATGKKPLGAACRQVGHQRTGDHSEQMAVPGDIPAEARHQTGQHRAHVHQAYEE